ncbi:GTPase family protein [Aliivibrio fischeri]|uniref:GTPase family protein n=1 Tax=Aliivibrio fischeri TaxID=668 RepID=UPI0012DADF96|nr:GTPase [Aliivibrio fischeri]MUL15830.1 GTP-binding protein HSR1 [Aliivibrio fischeri]
MFKNYRKHDLNNNIKIMDVTPLDIMITGVTGAGKSTTINSIFNKSLAEVGRGVEPETMGLNSYTLNNFLRLWDTPGLGDGIKQDQIHSKKIIDLLYKTYSLDSNNYGFIDMVLIIIEGSNRDMGTNYKLINEVIVPNIQRERVLVAINQADMAMKGRHWDSLNNKPKERLKEFLDAQVISIQSRVKEATGVDIIKPVYYSAENNYNVGALLDLLIDNMPKNRRTIG